MAETPSKTDYAFTSDIRGGTNLSGQVTGGIVVQGNYYGPGSPTAPNSGNENLSSIQSLLRKIYAKSYRSVIPVSSADFYFDIKEKWVNLTLKLEGDSAVTDDYTGLLKKAFADADMLIIEGDPGVGKSSLLHRLAYEWSQSRLADYDLVLYVEFRKLREYECKGIKELIIHYMKGYLHEEEYKILDNFLSDTKCCLEHNILVLLDGYDESCLEKQCQELSEYFHSSISRPLQFNVLITSRKGYLPNSRHLGRCVFADIIGFTTEPQTQEYMSKHFKAANEKESSEATAVVTHLLNTNGNIKELSETPLLLTIICLLHKKIIEGTEVELYLNIIWCLIDRHQRKNPQLDVPKLFELDHDASDKFSIIENNYQHFPQLHLLGKMAMQDIFKTTFTETDLKKFQLKEIVQEVGFLRKEITKDNSNRMKTEFSFVHRSIQEFIMALTFFFSNEEPTEIFSWYLFHSGRYMGYGIIQAEIQKFLNMISTHKIDINIERKNKYSQLINETKSLTLPLSRELEQNCTITTDLQDDMSHISRKFDKKLPQSQEEAIELVRDEANKDDAFAQYILGLIYVQGILDIQSDEEAVKWLSKSADQGIAMAQNALEDMNSKSSGVPQSDEEAVKLCTKSAEQGNENAPIRLVNMHHPGRYLPRTDEEAVKLNTKSAEEGNPAEQNDQGDSHLKDYDVSQSDEDPVQLHTKSAEQGNADAQVSLGFMYQYGNGVSQSYEEAVKWYTKAAEQGNAVGQRNLGEIYLNGRGVPQSNDEAIKWYTKAAEQGDATAQINLGFIHLNGLGTPQSDEEAAKWFSKAVELGYTNAQFNLDFINMFGRYLPRSDDGAVKWYKKTAEQGNPDAQSNLGWMYYIGLSVPQSDQEAIEWFRRAAEQENAGAQYNLGQMIQNGRGVPPSNEEAAEWYRRAAEQGYAPAMSHLGIA